MVVLSRILPSDRGGQAKARRPVIDNDNAARPGTGSSEIAAEPVASPVVGNTSTDVTGSGPVAGPENLGDQDDTQWIQGDGPGARGANLGDDAATGQDALATALGNDAGFVEEAGHHLDDTLGQSLDAATQQGGATAQTGADVKDGLGGEQLAGLTEVDEVEDLNPNDVIES